MAKTKLAPVIRVAPLGEIHVYQITEEELEQLRRGSSSSSYFNLCLFFAAAAMSFGITLISTTVSTRIFIVFVAVFVASLFATFILGVLSWRERIAAGDLVERIRRRMPPPESFQEGSVVKIAVDRTDPA